MGKYAAFLRGINVGGRVVKMADLRTCLERAGLSNVKTLLQSGNVTFESNEPPAQLKQKIETTLAANFNYPAKVQIVDIELLRHIAANYPFGTAGLGQHDYVIFIENDLEKDLVNEAYELASGEKVQAGDGVVYWRVDKGSTLKSDFAKLLTKAKYKQSNTTRNLRTITRLLNSL